MTLYDRIADLPLAIEGYDLERRERDTSSGFTRVSTVVSLAGETNEGRGEDVTYETGEHDALLAHDGTLPVAGEYTLSEFSAHLDEVDLFPAGAPDRAVFRHYRRWAFESAALDLALRRAETDLGTVLDREFDPVRFVTSARLGDPPTADRVRAWLDVDPGIEFKLDATPEWSSDLMAELADTGRVRVLDLKAHYEGTEVDADPDPDFYRELLSVFPECVVEDPGVTAETREVLAANADRLAWDAPIESLADVRELPWEPRWLNVKPSRFGSIESLFETIEYCLDRGVALYGGGQFELGVGRGQIQLLASLFYPGGPNDVAPRAYNDPEPTEDVPPSPLDPPGDPRGFRWSRT